MEKPTEAGNSPIFLNMKSGEYYWCACGKSSNQPFCDGSHQGTDFTPLPVKITEQKDVFWCTCKQSANKPFCDGTHKSL